MRRRKTGCEIIILCSHDNIWFAFLIYLQESTLMRVLYYPSVTDKWDDGWILTITTASSPDRVSESLSSTPRGELYDPLVRFHHWGSILSIHYQSQVSNVTYFANEQKESWLSLVSKLNQMTCGFYCVNESRTKSAVEDIIAQDKFGCSQRASQVFQEVSLI